MAPRDCQSIGLATCQSSCSWRFPDAILSAWLVRGITLSEKLIQNIQRKLCAIPS